MAVLNKYEVIGDIQYSSVGRIGDREDLRNDRQVGFCDLHCVGEVSTSSPRMFGRKWRRKALEKSLAHSCCAGINF